MRVPSAVTQLQDSPCLPPVDWITKCRAFAGGFASSVAGTCADAAEAAAAASAIETNVRCIALVGELLPVCPTSRLSAGEMELRSAYMCRESRYGAAPVAASIAELHVT